ncbi:hypothetical protein L249_4197, partial [Ophiocordyceps polyrhachis-furcata BCC 54312]
RKRKFCREKWVCLLKSVGRDGPNEVICRAKGEEEGGKKEVKREVFVLRRYFSRYFKVPTCSTLTYLYKIGDLEEDL